MTSDPKEILDFWFSAGEGKWFAHDPSFDAEIRRRFLPTYELAASDRLDDWMQDRHGALALVLLLDQFSRNLFRNDHRAYMQDVKALHVAEQAIERNMDVEFPMAARRWFYMPFMHAENLKAQEQGLIYFATRLDDPETLAYAEMHADIIRRFGRFPHRNAILGRRASEQEQYFLDQGGFKG